jgi:hypothetical protein
VAGFRALPQLYPSGQKWTAENKLYKPITKDIVEDVTHELTLQDIEQDPNWIMKSTCIVTSNFDRAIINAEATKAFGKCNNVPVLQWKCKLSIDFPLSAKAILYDKDERPKLFAYFVQGGSSQVLDNAHGNVYFGVANGTACTVHSLAWDDPEDKENAHKAIRISTKGQEIDLPKLSNHIIVEIKPVKGIKWKQGLNLSPNSDLIQILIGLTSQFEKKIKVGTHESVTHYAHAVEWRLPLLFGNVKGALLTISLPCLNTPLVVQLSPLRNYM